MKNRKFKEAAMKGVFLILALISVASVLLICVFIFSRGIPTISELGLKSFIFGSSWKPSGNRFGIFPMIVGSAYVTALSLLFGIPIALGAAVFLAFFCPKRIYKIFKPAINLLAGIPSVVYGFFGIVVIVPFIRSSFGKRGMSLLSAAILLSVMLLPTVITVAESSITALPKSYYEGSRALGVTKERAIFSVVLPAAKSGLIAGSVLGLGRAVGETMAVIMVAGNQPIIPKSLLSGVRTLTANIAMEMGYAAGLHRDALIASASVLFIFILIINLSFSFFKRRAKK